MDFGGDVSDDLWTAMLHFLKAFRSGKIAPYDWSFVEKDTCEKLIAKLEEKCKPTEET